MMRLWGVFLWTIFLLATLLLYGREEGRRLAEYRGLVHLISHINDSLAASPLPLAEIYARFSDEALMRTEFLSLLRRSGFSSALLSGGLHLSKAEKEPFYLYAEELGTRLYENEKQKTSALLRYASDTLPKKTAEAPRRRRLASTLFFTGGMLLLLLIL